MKPPERSGQGTLISFFKMQKYGVRAKLILNWGALNRGPPGGIFDVKPRLYKGTVHKKKLFV